MSAIPRSVLCEVTRAGRALFQGTRVQGSLDCACLEIGPVRLRLDLTFAKLSIPFELEGFG